MLAGCGGASTDGFEVTAPAGWKDQTDLTQNLSRDSVQAVWQSADASIVVVRAERPAGASLAEVMRAGQDKMRRSYPGATIGPVEPARLGGAPAARFDFTREGAQVRQLGALRGGHVYLITFTAKPAAFERRLGTLEALLRSWRWS